MKPHIVRLIGDDAPTSTLYYGHDVREVLKELPEQSVQTLCCSPPYWGLRSYGTDPLIWGGDPDCNHEWVDSSVTRKGSTQGRADLGSTIISVGGPKTLAPGLVNDVGETHQHRRDVSAQCSKCNAWAGSLGLEPTPEAFCDHLVEIFREARRVLADDGTLWLNLGDSFNSGSSGGLGGSTLSGGQLNQSKSNRHGREYIHSLKPKDLVGIPFRVAFALQADGWYLRSIIPWLKRVCMPEAVRDRPTQATEYVFLLTKQPSYFYDAEATRLPHGHIRKVGVKGKHTTNIVPNNTPHRTSGPDGLGQSERGRNRRNTDGFFEALDDYIAHLTKIRDGGGLLSDGDGDPLAFLVNPKPYRGAHFACWPENLVIPMIKAGCSEKGHCPKCRARWGRVIGERDIQVTKVESRGHSRLRPGSARPGDKYDRGVLERDPTGKGGSVLARKRIPTGGWEPGCDCGLDPIRDVVLDIFSGSATTGVVANRLGHDYIGIDLNAEYLPLAERRLKGISESTSSKDEEEPEEDMTIAGMFGPEKG